MADEKKKEEKVEEPKKGGALDDWSNGIDDQIARNDEHQGLDNGQMDIDRR